MDVGRGGGGAARRAVGRLLQLVKASNQLADFSQFSRVSPHLEKNPGLGKQVDQAWANT